MKTIDVTVLIGIAVMIGALVLKLLEGHPERVFRMRTGKS